MREDKIQIEETNTCVKYYIRPCALLMNEARAIASPFDHLVCFWGVTAEGFPGDRDHSPLAAPSRSRHLFIIYIGRAWTKYAEQNSQLANTFAYLHAKCTQYIKHSTPIHAMIYDGHGTGDCWWPRPAEDDSSLLALTTWRRIYHLASTHEKWQMRKP
jgi:hypothetical protein